MIEMKYAVAMLVASLCVVMPLYAPYGIKNDSLIGALCAVGAIIEWFVIWYVTLLFLW